MINILKKKMKNLFKIEKLIIMSKAILMKIPKSKKINSILNQALIVNKFKLLNKHYKNL